MINLVDLTLRSSQGQILNRDKSSIGHHNIDRLGHNIDRFFVLFSECYVHATAHGGISTAFIGSQTIFGHDLAPRRDQALVGGPFLLLSGTHLVFSLTTLLPFPYPLRPVHAAILLALMANGASQGCKIMTTSSLSTYQEDNVLIDVMDYRW